MLRHFINFSYRINRCSPVIKTAAAIIFSSLLLVFSFSSFNIWWCAWFAFIPLFAVLENVSFRSAFFRAYWCGLFFWLGSVYWLIHVTFVGLLILSAYLSLYFGVFGIFCVFSRRLPSLFRYCFLPAAWVVLEYSRSVFLTGFPWIPLGYSQYRNLPVIQIADVTGVWGVSFLVIAVNYAVYFWGSQKPGQVVKKIKPLVGVFMCVVIICGYGLYKLYEPRGTLNVKTLRISVVQGNIPQELKWDARKTEFIVSRYCGLTSQAAAQDPDLIIWPEAAYPVIMEREKPDELLEGFARDIGKPILLGGVFSDQEGYYNSAVLFSSYGKIESEYDKIHLVPFGEYVPLKNVFRFLETIVPIGDFSAGTEYTVFSSSNFHSRSRVSYSVLICFEDVFPGLSRAFIQKGARFLINITNDGWFKKTSAPYQHLSASVFRAVENRVNVVRAANTGISGFISPSGAIVSLIRDVSGNPVFIEGYLTDEIAIFDTPSTFYTRYGDVFIFLCAGIMGYGIIRYIRQYRTSKKAS